MEQFSKIIAIVADDGTTVIDSVSKENFISCVPTGPNEAVLESKTTNRLAAPDGIYRTSFKFEPYNRHARELLNW